jgi:hypothetical protein
MFSTRCCTVCGVERHQQQQQHFQSQLSACGLVLTVMRMFITTLSYSAWFMKPSRGEKPLQQKVWGQQHVVVIRNRKHIAGLVAPS